MRDPVDMALIPSFVEVVRQGSFTKAAAALGLPKSTVSRRVSKLEEALGVTLLVRTTRKLRLTEEGELFYRRVATAVECVEEAARAVAAQREEPQGLLRVTAPTDFEHLPGLVASFIERYPAVSVEINVSGDVVDLVAAGYDMAIRAGRLKDSSLIARKLSTVEFHLFASASYLDAHGEPASVADLIDHECVLFRARRGVSQWSLTGPGGVETVEVRGRLVVDDLLFARGAALAGVGIALLPRDMFNLGRDHVRRVLPDHAMPGGSVYAVYPAARHVPAKVRAFRDHLLESGAWHP